MKIAKNIFDKIFYFLGVLISSLLSSGLLFALASLVDMQLYGFCKVCENITPHDDILINLSVASIPIFSLVFIASSWKPKTKLNSWFVLIGKIVIAILAFFLLIFLLINLFYR